LPFYIIAQGLTIPTGAYIIAGNGNIVIKNNFTNNGSFTHIGGTVIFNGTTQTISGTGATSFYNLTINSGSTTSISSAAHKIKNVLLSNGTLNANGNLTLLSTATQTAAIDGGGTGQVLGTVIMQRYLSSAFGYKYFSSPFQSDTVGDFSNDMNLAASFPAFYKHDESLTTIGWVSYTTGSGALNVLTGYAANLGSSNTPVTVDLKGVVNSGSKSRALANNNRTYTQGFNLVGNPYPSPINWSASSGWTKTNIDNAVYYFNASALNQYTGVYSSYVNGVSSDGIAGSTIAAMQGFFVHVSNGTFPVSATLGTTNSVRILNSSATFYKVSNQDDHPLLRLKAGFNEHMDITDPVTIYFDNAATPGFNKEIEALKILNTDSLIPNIYALSADAQKLSIKALDNIQDAIAIVPLGFSIKKDGYINFSLKDMHLIPAGLYIYFNDAAAAINHDLKKDSVYTVLLPAGEYANRFSLRFSNKDLNAPVIDAVNHKDEPFTIYSAGGKLYVNGELASDKKASISVVNMLGQVIYRSQVSGIVRGAIVSNVASGVYIVHISSDTKNQTKKIFIGNQ
jgi:hypothetical protein